MNCDFAARWYSVNLETDLEWEFQRALESKLDFQKKKTRFGTKYF